MDILASHYVEMDRVLVLHNSLVLYGHRYFRVML